MQQPRRAIRLFVSSTFRDMQAERDELHRVVYPSLRSFCRERQVDFVEVDLRWGITADEAEKNETLGICLDEIEHCRPYFICLLGERYGWIPEYIPSDAEDAYPWLARLKGHSVTHLEIVQGALNNPAEAKHALFYFRDKCYADTVPYPARVDYLSTGTEAEQKLQTLKALIRSSGLPVVEDYPSPAKVAERILSDLCVAIEADYPKQQIPDALALENNGHTAYAQDRSSVYIRRDADQMRLDSFAAKRGKYPLLVTGESGIGKSSLLANWALERIAGHSEEFVFMHFIGSTPQSAACDAMLRRLLGWLKESFGIASEIPGDFGGLCRALPDFLSMASKSGRRIILLLDSLNQLDDLNDARQLAWLPVSFPENIRAILSTLPGKCMEAMSLRKHERYNIKPMTAGECSQFVDAYLARYSKRLDERQKDFIIEMDASRNPLYLRILLDELRKSGNYDRLDDCIKDYLGARNIPSLLDKVLERLERDFNHDGSRLVQETLMLLWCARRGLAESEILDLLGRPPQAAWSPFYFNLVDITVRQGMTISFAHDYIRQAVEARYLSIPGCKEAAKEKLASYFEKQDTSARTMEELPHLLAGMQQWQRLYNLMSQPIAFLMLWERDRYEAKSCWARIEDHTQQNKTEAYSAVIAHPEDYRPPLLAGISLLLMDTGHNSEARRLMAHLLRRYRAEGDADGMQRVLGYIGNLWYSRSHFKKALETYRWRERLCRELGNMVDLQSALGNLGLIHFYQGNTSAAISLYEEVERICRKIHYPDGLQIALGNRGNAFYALGEKQKAFALYRRQELICRRMGNLSGLKTALGCQGVILNNRGELDKAMELYKEQERICKDLGDLDGLQVCLGNQGNILYSNGDIVGSLRLYREKEEICRTTGNLQGLQVALGNMGLILVRQGALGEALCLFVKQASLCRKLRIAEDLVSSLCVQAEILEKLGKPARCKATALKAMAIAVQNGFATPASRMKALLDTSGE